jgi:hypothetical protein
MKHKAFAAKGLLAVTAAAGIAAWVNGGNAAVRAAEPRRPSAKESTGPSWVNPGVPHPGSDQIYWVPTFAQAEEMARATGRLMLVMGSVGDWNGY